MRPMVVYLFSYFLVLGIAAAVLWRAGVLSQIPFAWLFFAGFLSIALGVVLAVMSMDTTRPRARTRQ